ncbi:MAG: prepilin-type N-terminal cleavage/methylation domain-containing protein [Candidatus Omnitrophica bacterium]|nr:prepilin-type N-terminal cleavage/methylation domain-containing protein [Candidatus Omnitrophota bacterium]
MRKNDGFTLVELLLVVAIIITLALIAVPNYNKSKLRSRQREAISSVKLIAAAERIYRMETGDYHDCNCTSAATCSNGTVGCNSVLNLLLNTQNWSYNVTTAGDEGSKNATITAAAKSGNCTYTLNNTVFDTAEPSPGEGCI